MFSKILISLFRDSSQHFQVGLQVLRLNPKNLWKLFRAGFWLFVGGKKAARPIYLHIEPTGACNLKCTLCARTTSITREMSHMSFERFKKVLDEVDPLYVAFIGFGEPFLNKELFRMIQYAKKRGILTKVSTNSTMLKPKEIVESGLDHIQFSIDGANKESFEKIRIGANFSEVKNNIKELLTLIKQKKSKLKAMVHFTITKENVHEISEMIEFCQNEFGIPLTFASSYGYDLKVHQNLKIEKSDAVHFIKKGIDKAQQFNLRNTELNLKTIQRELLNANSKKYCYLPYYVVAVSWDGKVSPCCLYYNYQNNLGDLNSENFNKVWNGQKYQKFRVNLNEKRQQIDICKTCEVNDASLHGMMSKMYRIPFLRPLTNKRYQMDRS